MSDFAGVDPHRVRALADRLKDLADVLEQQAPTIRRLFDEWHGTVKQEALNKDEARDQFKNFSPAIAQGLIRSGAIPPPTGQSWYDPATGVVFPSPEQQNEFTTWWANVGVRAQYLNSFQSGFITSEGSLDGK